MKRNWDTIREALEMIESLGEQQFQGTGYSYGPDTPAAESDRVRHMLLLRDAGFIRALPVDTLGTTGLIGPELTWAGHELLDVLRSQSVWNKVKALATQKGIELSLDSIKALAKIALDQVLSGAS